MQGSKNIYVLFCRKHGINYISIYTLSDLRVLSNLIGSLSLANEYYSPPTERIIRKPNKIKMAGVNSRFASVSELEILKIQEDAVPENIRKATKFGVKVFRGKRNIIIGGDFNRSLTHLDKAGGKPVENKKCVINKISNLINLYFMRDV